MRRSNPLAATLAALTIAALSACSMMDDGEIPDEQSQRGPLFEAVDYRVNAANYFDRGFYDRARQQFETSLEVEPGVWGARLGIAACDAYEASQLLDRGDVARARRLLDRAESRCKELWDGTIGDSTLEDGEAEVQPWRAAMTLAITWRFQHDADRIEAAAITRRIEGLGPQDEERSRLVRRHAELVASSEARRESALELLDRLVQMEAASPDAVLQRAELLALEGRKEAAEREFLRYREMARRSHDALLVRKEAVRDEVLDDNARRVAIDVLEAKIETNESKQIAVLMRLSGLAFDRAMALRRTIEAGLVSDDRLAERKLEVSEELSSAIDHLNAAQELAPERLDILVKLAQCETALGLHESALDHLEHYIRRSSREGRAFDREMAKVFELKESIERKLRARGSER